MVLANQNAVCKPESDMVRCIHAPPPHSFLNTIQSIHSVDRRNSSGTTFIHLLTAGGGTAICTTLSKGLNRPKSCGGIYSKRSANQCHIYTYLLVYM